MRFLAAILALVLLLAPLAVFAEDAKVTVDIECEDVVFMGRWEKEEDGLMHGSFECGLVLRFTGTGISLNGAASGTALIAVDGGDVQYAKLSKDAVLFSGLEEGEHTLELYSAAQQCFPVLGGFTLDPGAQTLASVKGRIVEFIGDSITEGYVDPNDAPPYDANSYKYSYAFLTGRRLMQEYGVRFSTIAIGGIRIVERGDNDTGDDPLGMPERYFLNREYKDWIPMEQERAATHKWDTSAYTPDVIVINLGTNDWLNSNPVVAAAMLSFLQNLRETYEKTVILVMTPFNGAKSNPIRKAVDSANDEKIVLINTKTWKIKGGSDGLHPNPASHVTVSELLYEIIKPYIEAEEEPVTTEEPKTEAPTETVTEAPTDAPTDAPAETREEPVIPEKKEQPVWPYIVGGVLLIAVSAGIALFAVRKKK